MVPENEGDVLVCQCCGEEMVEGGTLALPEPYGGLFPQDICSEECFKWYLDTK